MTDPAAAPHRLFSDPPGSPERDGGGALHRHIRRRVLDLMLSGEAPPGRRLSVSGLARETGFSRTPVREALLQLQREGFLTLEENRGFFVRELTEREARELYPILYALEDLALVTGGRPSPARLERLEELNDRLSRARRAEEAIALNFAWHRVLTETPSNRELSVLLDRYRMRVYLYEHAYYAAGPERLEYSVSLHRRILEALRAGDLRGARRTLERHWVGDYSLYLPASGPGGSAGEARERAGGS